ncbi:hypothetical protein KQY27_01120 [Methanobrevibacter sp. TMH8]|uniref:hypothetical protein n=1 Tax=Methanobrevibacter sp. TMH8 TaxID=2848611 RepID=UPI001CCD342F|nr:hypothetical protein [Methanobrevibacter sp. TMH8]MBZ9570154.1 hypothetical protein [Methanobrevibacter sp. TMH8]
MNNKFIALIIVIIIAVCGVSAFLLTQDNINNNGSSNGTMAGNNTGNNTMGNNTTNVIPSGNTNNKGVTDQNGVIASLNGPKYSAQGKTVNLVWKITNNGSETIQNVQAQDQSNSHDFGNIAPGESKTFTASLNIPTLAQVKQDFGPDATIANPFSIGGFSVTYSLNGENFQFNSNSLDIRLV